MAKDPKHPYGTGITYADPGFQPDGKARYPLDTPEHIKAAAAYFGKPANKAKYTPAQQAKIQAAIDAAEKNAGIGEPKTMADVADNFAARMAAARKAKSAAN